MTEKQFSARLAEIDQEHARRRELADAYRDQELARLFVEAKESGRNQEWLAQRMGKTRQWVSLRLTFGRFLTFATTVAKTESLTERRFREYWRRTKGTEEERFAQVAEIIETAVPQGRDAQKRKPGVKSAVVEILEDGEWHTVPELTDAMQVSLPGVTENQVRNSIQHDIDARPPRGATLDRERTGRATRYRLTRDPNRSVTPIERLYEQVEPLLDELDTIANFHGANTRQALAILKMVSVKLRRTIQTVLEELTARSR